MEPAFRGPRVEWNCGVCKELNSLAVDTVAQGMVVACAHCGQRRTIEEQDDSQRTDGDRVLYSRSDVVPRRFDSIVFGSDEELTIKRVVGLPGEHIEINGGDLWVDGVRAVKSPGEFRQQMISMQTIEYFTEYANTPSWIRYSAGAGWPHEAELRIDPKLDLIDYVVDDLDCNAKSNFSSVRVSDLGVRMLVDSSSDPRLSIDIAIYFDGETRYVPCRFSFKETCELITACVDGTIIVELNAIDAVCFQYSDHPIKKTLYSEQIPIWQSSLQVEHDRDSIELTPSQPIAFRFVSGHDRVTKVAAIRDIHYRGPNGESYFSFAADDGYIVLGDNVSISFDSRHFEAPRIPKSSIVGRVLGRLGDCGK